MKRILLLSLAIIASFVTLTCFWQCCDKRIHAPEQPIEMQLDVEQPMIQEQSVMHEQQEPSAEPLAQKQKRGQVMYLHKMVTRGQSATQVFNKLISDKAVVDFYTDWCGPCKQMSPYIDKLAKEFPSIAFVKVNTEKCKDVARSYDITSIPQLFYFKNGTQVHHTFGARSKKLIKADINQYLL